MIKKYEEFKSRLWNTQLLAVTKYQSDEIVLQAVRWWIDLIWESKIQDAKRKYTLLEAEWLEFSMHMIGHLQTNKVAEAVQIFAMIQSVDSEKLLRKIDGEANKIDKTQDILLQLNLTNEEQKYGFDTDQLWEIVQLCSTLEHIHCKWLMCMGKYNDDEVTRAVFQECKQLCDYHSLEICSMGMTHDWEIAIHEGSTMLRIGSGIFG